MWSAVVLLLLSAELGPVVRQDGYQMKPPATFRMARMDLFHGTQVGTISAKASASRYLSAALVDGEGEDAASLLISVVETTLSLGPSSRDELSTAVVRHLRDELGQPFALERAEVTNGRVQVLGSVRQGSQLRRILVAAWPGEARHVVAICSAPSGRWDSLAPVISDSFDSMRVEPASSPRPSRRFLWAFAAFVAALMLISIGLWRRRQATRNAA